MLQSVTNYFFIEFAEKLTFFSQTAGNGFASGCVLSRTRPDAHTPKVGFEKSQKFVNFWIFPHPQFLIVLLELELHILNDLIHI